MRNAMPKTAQGRALRVAELVIAAQYDSSLLSTAYFDRLLNGDSRTYWAFRRLINQRFSLAKAILSPVLKPQMPQEWQKAAEHTLEHQPRQLPLFPEEDLAA